MNALQIRFTRTDGGYTVGVESPAAGEASGAFEPPFAGIARRAVMRALEPRPFDPQRFSDGEREALADLGLLRGSRLVSRFHLQVGQRVYDALAAGPEVQTALHVTLTTAAAKRQPLLTELRFMQGAHDLTGLPWELLCREGHFLVRETRLALTRWLGEAIPPTQATGGLPLRLLLVTSRPAGAVPLDPVAERRALLHGLRALQEEAAVVVDNLRPPTSEVLVEAVRGGGYHALHFDGHGGFGLLCPDCDTLNTPESAVCRQCGVELEGEEPAGYLLFEDEYGGPELVAADELRPTLRNSDVRLAVLSACQSGAVGAGEEVWSGVAPALLEAGVPLVVGMQVSVPANAAAVFARQFYATLARGEPLTTAVAEGRLPLAKRRYRNAWFIPALYGRVRGDYRLFDTEAAGEAAVGGREWLQRLHRRSDELEAQLGQLGVAHKLQEIAKLRRTRKEIAAAYTALTRRAPGKYAPVASVLYRVPSNPYFVGRAAELRQVGEALESRQCAAIWGLPGIGKSALAIEYAHRQSWRYPGGVVWLSCKGNPPFDGLLNQMGAFCGDDLSQAEPEHKEAQVRGLLAGLDAECLLMWDNFEDLLAGEQAETTLAFLQHLPPNGRALIASRQNPDLLGWAAVPVTGLQEQPMAQLFWSIARDRNVQLATEEGLQAVQAMLDFFDGHPLALTLVVPLAETRQLARIWEELQKQPLKGVEASLAISVEALDEEQQALFGRLSAFGIPFDEEAAAAVGGVPNALQRLGELVRRSLVQFDGQRYSYHSLVRQYAQARLVEREDTRPAHRRAAEYLQARLTGQEQGATPEEALEEVDQWEWAEDWEAFARRTSDLVGSVAPRGYWSDIMARLERARAAVAGHMEDARLEGTLLNNMGTIARKQAEWDRAIEYYERSLETIEWVGDDHGMAQTYDNLGVVYRLKGEWDRAKEYCERSLEMFERVGDDHGIAATCRNLGEVYRRKGEWDRAIEFHQRSLETFEQVDDIHGMAQTHNTLGIVYMERGEWDRAIEFYQRSLEAFERMGDIHGVARTRNNLGIVYKDKDELDRAIEYCQRSLETFEQVGDIHGMASAYNNMGEVYAKKREWDRAYEFYEKDLEISELLADRDGLAQTWDSLGRLSQQRGQWDRAIEFYQRSLETFEHVGNIHGMAQIWGNLGLLRRQQGQEDAAARYLAQAYLVFSQLGAAPGAQQARGDLVSLLGSPEAAQAYLREFLSRHGDDSRAWPPVEPAGEG